MDDADETEELEPTGPQSPLFGLPLPEGFAVVGWGTLVVLIYVALTIGTGGYTERSITAAIRWTGRISMLIFLAAYLRAYLAPQAEESLGGWAARNYTSLLGLLGASHTIHGAAIAAYAYSFAPHFDETTLAVGGLGYVFIYLLAAMAASGRLAASALSASVVETLATHYVWFVFVATAGSSIGRKPEAALFTMLCLAAAYYRYRGMTRASD